MRLRTCAIDHVRPFFIQEDARLYMETEFSSTIEEQGRRRLSIFEREQQ